VKFTGVHDAVHPPSTRISHCALALSSMLPHESMMPALAGVAKPKNAVESATATGAKNVRMVWFSWV
jgi:hypothetical protein